MHQAALWLAERLPVPLINPGPMTYKLVEAMLALKLTHSRACYPKPQVPKLDMLHAMLDAAAAQQKGGEVVKNCAFARQPHLIRC